MSGKPGAYDNHPVLEAVQKIRDEQQRSRQKRADRARYHVEID